MRSTSIVVAWAVGTLALAQTACSGDDSPFLPPQMVIDMQLPAELPPAAAPCLDVIISSPDGTPPNTSVAFGGNPLLVTVQTAIGNDGRKVTRIRFKQGSLPFLSALTTLRIIRNIGVTVDINASLEIGATARLADGTASSDDRCLDGTALASGRATQDSSGQIIKFPAKGEVDVHVPLACVRASGCAIAAPDGGTTATDGGSTATDGGTTATDGGTTATDGGTTATDGGTTATDGGTTATDGGM